MDHNQVGVVVWFFHPEGTENRELFTRWIGSFDGQATRRQAIGIAFTQSTEVACSLEYKQFIKIGWAVERVMHTKTTITNIFSRQVLL
ncbi:Uncharacterised protein [Vibrio cholerae]|nr:Uncharacterised protein [Vibrio cholerae]CSB14745.1 Uncharacterised protein [Vibrio cholerae]